MADAANKSGKQRIKGELLRLLLTSFFLLVTFIEGLTLCLCPSSSEASGDHCHSSDQSGMPSPCGPVNGDASLGAESHDCEHVSIADFPPSTRPTGGITDLRCLLVMQPAMPHGGVPNVPTVFQSAKRPPGALRSHALVILRTTHILC